MSGAKFIHWFRMDLRLHDVPTITTALKSCSSFYPVYIFDEDDIKEQKIRYNKVRFIIDALNDINNKLQLNGGRLYVFKGNPAKIFSAFSRSGIFHTYHMKKMYNRFGKKQKNLYKKGQPPVTYEVFCHVVDAVSPPPRPEPDLNLDGVLMPRDDSTLQDLPNEPEDLGVYPECIQQKNKIWVGGEVRALEHLRERLKVEEAALADGFFMPTQAQPDLLGPSMSLSAALSLGCLSVRKLYWSLQDLHSSINPDLCVSESLINQLLWREYFYAMCKNNPNYGTMRENPICLNIPWLTDDQKLKSWTNGQTGFPFIDAAMRQMIQEGWVHHVGRNAVACFLTRVDLWISWEEGFKIFMKYLIDADFPVCAGNWMWVSSSAFENILQCPTCISPISYGRCVEPSGNYIRKYVPELRNMPTKYIFEPWLAPLSVQEQAGCIIGTDYPYPIVNHEEAAKINRKRMDSIKAGFYQKPFPLHCAPSNAMETRVFMWLPEKCIENLKSN
ncbi:Cryptochrome-1 like protein [Argiope bruennichi]|uniref:Cryptochrome-1 n=1 Tax=Argiope bruennichi TaxID=94029 RepID=A0A8T0ENY6_ARGBR|nr:Cryptochrome-1 like protein [Argiope bruennichi]